MQPATQPPPQRGPHTHQPLGDEGELYARHHRELERAVARRIHAPRELIEDACQNAWAILLRVQPPRPGIFPWLYVVALHEAIRLSRRERRDPHLDDLFPDGSWDTQIPDRSGIDEILQARDALRILADLPERQRTDLALLIAGYTYKEIAELTGGRTYTNVNKHIAKARRRVRLARLKERGQA